MRIETISTLDDPRLRCYREMKRMANELDEIFIAEGEKVVRRLLESDLEVVSLLAPPHVAESLIPLIATRPHVEIFSAEKSLLEQLVGYKLYQGVLAAAKAPKPSTLENILATNAKPHFFVAVDGVSSAENMGVLIRNAVAFGAQAIIRSENSCPAYLRRSVRNSMGAIFKIPEITCPSLSAFLRELQSNGIRCIAAHPHTTTHRIYETNFGQNCCLVFGSEGHGVSAEVRDACDQCVAIPMQSEIDSLNVASAAAVFFYEADRQRRLLD